MTTKQTIPSDVAQARIRDKLADAYDFDPRDPLFGLSAAALSGPRLERRVVLRLLAAAGMLTAGHLVGAPHPARAQGKAGGTLNCGWAGVGEIVTLDPAQINQVLQFQISSNVLSGLMHINAELVAQGDLAESWEVSDDGTEYTFRLREGVTFHNGDKFTAEDVLFTYQRSRDPQKSIHSAVLANVAAVDKVNDYTVHFKLKAPQASFLPKVLERSSGRAMTIVSRGALEKMGKSDYGLMPVGTGPFKVTAHQLGQTVTLERNPDYYDKERPKLDKVVIQPIIDAEPLAAAIEAGDIQLIGGNPIAPELIDRFASNPDLVVDETPGPTFQALWINPWHEHMKVADFNKPVEELMSEKGFKARLAIAKAIDRDAYIKQAQFGRGVRPDSVRSIRRRSIISTPVWLDQRAGFRSREGQAADGRCRLSGRRGLPEVAFADDAGQPPRDPGRRQPAQAKSQHRRRDRDQGLSGPDRGFRHHELGPGPAGQRRRLRSRTMPWSTGCRRSQSSMAGCATRPNTRSASSPTSRSTS